MPPGLPLRDVLPILYPEVADTGALEDAALAVIGADTVQSGAQLRALIAGLDQSRYPSAVSIRFRQDDLVCIDLDSFALYLDRSDPSVSALIEGSHNYEPHVTAAITRYCTAGMTALDIGANIGFHTMLLSRAVGPTGHVIAFEPSSENCRLILASAARNAIENVSLLPVALDSHRGWSHFMSYLGSNGGLLNETTPQFVDGVGLIVPTFDLDTLIDEPVGFIKIDVEGAEARAIDGARETLRKHRPVVVSEFSVEMLSRVSEVDPLQYLSWFEELGYQINILDRDHPGSLLPFASPTEFIDRWGSNPVRIEDLLFLPM